MHRLGDVSVKVAARAATFFLPFFGIKKPELNALAYFNNLKIIIDVFFYE